MGPLSYNGSALILKCIYFGSVFIATGLLFSFNFQKVKIAGFPVPGVTFHIRHKFISRITSEEATVRRIRPGKALAFSKHFLALSVPFLFKRRMKSIAVQIVEKVLPTLVISRHTRA